MKNKKSPILKNIRIRKLPSDAMAIYFDWSNERHFLIEIPSPRTKKKVLNAFLKLIRMMLHDDYIDEISEDQVDINTVYVKNCSNCFAHHEQAIASLKMGDHWCGFDKSIPCNVIKHAAWNKTFPEDCPIKNGLNIKIGKD